MTAILKTDHIAGAGLQDVLLKDRDAALGVAVRLFLRHANFAQLPFGHWASILNGQILRDHYRFVLRGNEVVGFFGWCFADEAHADRWLAGGDLPFELCVSGNSIVVNALVAATPEVSALIVRKLRAISGGSKYGYAKRYYADGRMRAVKLRLISDRAGP